MPLNPPHTHTQPTHPLVGATYPTFDVPQPPYSFLETMTPDA